MAPPKIAGLPVGKLTPKLAAEIITHIREGGLWRHNAAALVGIGERTLEGWVAKGRAELEKIHARFEATGELPGKITRYAQFLISLERAEAEMEARMVGVILKVAQAGDNSAAKLAAATWYLGRKRNLVYGRGSQRTDIIRPDDEGVDVEDDSFVMGQLEAYKARHGLLTGKTPIDLPPAAVSDPKQPQTPRP